ncbi:MAG TPA: circularly permuted type 2 ATP-grasp protein [Solirubrobacterales bacterium]|nr:circularly permuted type 2 ATP-grasp protein [Solirubrobacterales bacterium]
MSSPAPDQHPTAGGDPEALPYAPLEGRFDEAFAQSGRPHSHTEGMIESLNGLGSQRLQALGERRDTIFMQRGITFDSTEPDGQTRDRPFPLDLVPRVISAAEWEYISSGVQQRVQALNRFVADVYGDREIIRDGIVPWRLVATRPGFARVADGLEPPNGVWCHVSGCDLVRDNNGIWRVLEDNVRVPSGISYVLENRIAMGRIVPELFAGYAVRPVANYPELLLDALLAAAPTRVGRPTVVVWTPGPANSAYFEHAFLARQMGVELVEGSDLVVRDAACYMKTTNGLRRVDAIYRRIDEDFIDPLELRADSVLGVPGLMRAYREGNVSIANAVGTGVADDKAIYHFVPDMIRYYLNEEPVIANVPTWLLEDPEQRDYVEERIDKMVVKPTGEAGGKGVFIGPSASDEEVARQRDLIAEDPGNWIAQEVIWLSCAPTLVGGGEMAPRCVDLRPFAVYGDEIEIVPGGLTRVAMREGSMIVNSSQGGGSKDTWVLGGDGGRGRPHHDFDPPTMPDLPQVGWTEQGQQQQQGSR